MGSERGNCAFSSRVFKIVVGPSAKTFYAHADIIGKSDALRMVVQGGGKEMEEGNIVWPDWSVIGAEKFLEWLYTGDYKCPYPSRISEQEVRSGEEWSSVMTDDEKTAVDSDASGADRPRSAICLDCLNGLLCFQCPEGSEAVIARIGGTWLRTLAAPRAPHVAGMLHTVRKVISSPRIR